MFTYQHFIYKFIISPTYGLCLAHTIFLPLMDRIMFGFKKARLLIMQFDPNSILQISSSVPCAQTLYFLCPSLYVRKKLSRHVKNNFF